ncbi:TetR/AcrR family transcriptional regulator [Streptomyces cirratus]|uniref:TetR/AcrR family transcriptional regulator n=1 Tax=Streptomyces cirratus TaxID=68187 RepID=UPI00361D1E4E
MPRPREFEPDAVLDQAMLRFWWQGYRATSIEDLVKATGVKPGSLYSAFPGGKRTLFLRSLERYSKLVVPQKLGELAAPGASLSELRGYFDGLVSDLLSPEGRQGCLLVNTAIENAAEDDEAAAVVRGHLARLEQCMTTALRNARDTGEVRASVDPGRQRQAAGGDVPGAHGRGEGEPRRDGTARDRRQRLHRPRLTGRARGHRERWPLFQPS